MRTVLTSRKNSKQTPEPDREAAGPSARTAQKASALKEGLLIAAGSASAVLGAVGLFLPVLPTTPFLLLSAFCFVRSSPKLYRRLMNTRVLGAHIRQYLQHRAVLKSSKIYATVFLWAGLISSMIAVRVWYVWLILFLVGIGVSVHLLTLKTIEKADMQREGIDGENPVLQTGQTEES